MGKISVKSQPRANKKGDNVIQSLFYSIIISLNYLLNLEIISF